MQAQHIIRDIVVSNPIVDISAGGVAFTLHFLCRPRDHRPAPGCSYRHSPFILEAAHLHNTGTIMVQCNSLVALTDKINCFWNNCYQMAGLSTAALHAPSACKHGAKPSSMQFSQSTPRKIVFGQQFPHSPGDPRTDGQESKSK